MLQSPVSERKIKTELFVALYFGIICGKHYLCYISFTIIIYLTQMKTRGGNLFARFMSSHSGEERHLFG